MAFKLNKTEIKQHQELSAALRVAFDELTRVAGEREDDIKPANDEYLSTADAAQIARVTPGTVRRWVRARQIARHGTGPRVRIRRDELERYLAGERGGCERSATSADLRETGQTPAGLC